MKASFVVSLLLSLGVSATPAVDTTTIEDGGFTYTGIDKVCKSPNSHYFLSLIPLRYCYFSSHKANINLFSLFSLSVALRPVATASPATLLTPTVPQESASVLETTAAGLVAVDACSVSLALALDSAGPKRFRLLFTRIDGLYQNHMCTFGILTDM
ncbi:hypothetical protein QX201_007518 [Fusarium graminearum]|nr:hypothetical protein HG531_013500 [Fusarium graminearum]